MSVAAKNRNDVKESSFLEALVITHSTWERYTQYPPAANDDPGTSGRWVHYFKEIIQLLPPEKLSRLCEMVEVDGVIMSSRDLNFHPQLRSRQVVGEVVL